MEANQLHSWSPHSDDTSYSFTKLHYQPDNSYQPNQLVIVIEFLGFFINNM